MTARPRSSFGVVLRSPLYRRATASLFFAGLGISIAMPQLSLFLVQDLDASLPVAGLFFLTNLAAPVLGFVVGRWSDRMSDRLFLFRVGAVVGLVGWVVLAFTTEVWMAFVVNFTLLGFAGATGSLIFAAVRDQLTHAPTGADNRVMSTVRLGFSLGFMTGPLLGSVLGGVAGLRITLIAAGLCTVLQAAPLIGQTVTRAVPAQALSANGAADQNSRRPASLAPLITFLGLCVLAMGGDTIRFAYLPIFMELQLGTADWLRGAVISVQSVGMLVFIPIMGVLADRFGAQRLVVVQRPARGGREPRLHDRRQRVDADYGHPSQRGDVGDPRRDRDHRGPGPVPDRDRPGIIALLFRDPLLRGDRRHRRRTGSRLVRCPRRLRGPGRHVCSRRRRTSGPGPVDARAPATQALADVR